MPTNLRKQVTPPAAAVPRASDSEPEAPPFNDNVTTRVNGKVASSKLSTTKKRSRPDGVGLNYQL